jgi:hypothetical protein
VHKTYKSLSEAQKLAMQTASSELHLATVFIHQSDRGRFGKLSEELENSFTKGNDDYPDNLLSAHHLINECEHCTPRSAAPDSSGVAFTQKSEKGNDNHNNNKDDSWQKKATCHHCGEVGHIRHNCPALEDADNKEPDVDKLDGASKDKKTEKKKKKLHSLNKPLKRTMKASLKVSSPTLGSVLLRVIASIFVK